MERQHIMQRVFQALNDYLVGGPGCPRAGSLGECAAMDEAPGGYVACVSWWAPGRINSTRLAQIVRDQGGVDIWINHELYSDANMARNGRDGAGCRGLEISFNGTGEDAAMTSPPEEGQ